MQYKNEKDTRIKIFEDTLRLCTANIKINEYVRKSISKQQLILETDTVRELEFIKKYDEDTDIVVSPKRSLEAAAGYKEKKVCVLNFASATNPGGGVAKGSNAQEECLCRCSTLYPCISEKNMRNGFHIAHRNMLYGGEMNALYNDDCIYTPDVLVMKTDTKLPELMPEKRWFTVDVITCAAPNLRERPSNTMNPGSGKDAVHINSAELKMLHTKRANRILDIAKANGIEVVILGAFGCGAFQNPPSVVAEGMWEAVKQHRRDFEVIEFAVYCTPKDKENFETFQKYFGGKLC